MKSKMLKTIALTMALACLAVLFLSLSAHAREKWTPEQANAWYDKQPWLVGANYTPAYAINQLEMWQAETFDPAVIDKELAWAKSLGFNSMRVFLHHLLWEQDKEGLLKRMDQFLEIAHKHGIGIMFVPFDSVWDPSPKLGKQREPQKGVHNSGWVQSPGKADLLDKSRHGLLEEYVRGVVGRFKDDPRVHAWDIWNEPDNMNDNSYGRNHLKTEPDAATKQGATLELLKKAFVWAREANPTQPVTSGPWLGGHKADPARLIPMEKVQLEESDVITFHTYGKLGEAKAWVANLRKHNRPILCTEYMARPVGSTFDPTLAYFKEEKIGGYCWGFVAGKSNTIFAWETWQKPEPNPEPKVWFHDIFRTDGTPFDAKEVEYIQKVTGVKN
ncbi:cellulase family glycosylhydrolase [Anatilimnocola floriformis]|uniref:cellulase family glycosylhydrolase n=1 Tax=Anatilimnocola floriformis TaxID=2948575 RepID=UPI0020C50900|nr:cellulase family glycosylhydrolase [Anatilimnocola floriformis]